MLGFNDESVALSVEQLLKTIGLTKNFAEVVLFCGHQAEADNNPFKASLDCGACGGNGGIPNALLVCNVLNDAKVRKISQ